MQQKKSSSLPPGVGIYTPKEAALYTGIAASDIRDWVFGYRVQGVSYPGLWTSQLALLGKHLLGFHDLLEIRFVHAFHQHGVGLPAIRSVSRQAIDMFERQYPFACRRFQTYGRSFCAGAMYETGDESVLDMIKRQWVFQQVIKPSFYNCVEYSSEGMAQRWYPLPRNKYIVLDPVMNSGKPTLAQSGIATSDIYQVFQAEEGDLRQISKIFNISYPAIYMAVAYEGRLAA